MDSLLSAGAQHFSSMVRLTGFVYFSPSDFNISLTGATPQPYPRQLQRPPYGWCRATRPPGRWGGGTPRSGSSPCWCSWASERRTNGCFLLDILYDIDKLSQNNSLWTIENSEKETKCWHTCPLSRVSFTPGINLGVFCQNRLTKFQSTFSRKTLSDVLIKSEKGKGTKWFQGQSTKNSIKSTKAQKQKGKGGWKSDLKLPGVYHRKFW